MASDESSLPTAADFNAYTDCCDTHHAWEMFGELTLAEAYAKFCQHPAFYQEDFCYMGTTAFAYYLPVIERYVLESGPHGDGDNMQMLAYYLGCQFKTPDDNALAIEVVQRIARHVRRNLSQYDEYPPEQAEIDEAWQSLENRLQLLGRGD